jgi:zinc/manganese transport system substrate-binding protein
VKFILFGITLLFAGLSACQQSSHQSETKLKILTTIAPLYCFTINITGDHADVENLLPSGAGPHEYSFIPRDVKKITQAQVLIKNGVNLEGWLDDLIVSADKKKLIIVDTSLGVEIIDKDPHIWLSPRNAIIQVRNITNALVRIDPEHGEIYKKNAEDYIHRLKALDEEIRDEIKTWKRKGFVAFHSAFLYFARDYGLKQAAVIQESPEKEPTPRHIVDVINTIKAANIKVIFSELQSSHKIIEAIARDLKLQVLSLDTLETGDFTTEGPEWYENRIRENIKTLRKALGG